jgi:GNAT superfamily N-acetyltransferase
MQDLSFEVIAVGEMSTDILAIFCRLKDQHWPHGLEAQKMWWHENSNTTDMLPSLWRGNELVAFVRLRDRDIVVNNQEIRSQCITEVCVEKSAMGQNVGSYLLHNVFRVLREKFTGHGHLLCTRAQLAFYQKCGMKVATKTFRRIDRNQDYEEVQAEIFCCVFAPEQTGDISIKLTGTVY